MSSVLERSGERKTENEWQRRLRMIDEKPVTPENVGRYFDDSITELLELIQAVRAHEETRGSNADWNAEREDAALEAAGLPDVPHLLKGLLQKRDAYRDLERAILVDEDPALNILPPAHGVAPTGHNDMPTNGSKKNDVFERQRALAFILSDIGLTGTDIASRHAPPPPRREHRSARRQGYTVVEIPRLRRAVFISDEERNATYIIDTSVLATVEPATTVEELMGMEKNKIKQLIERYPALGIARQYRTPEGWTKLVKSDLTEPRIGRKIEGPPTREESLMVESEGEWSGFARLGDKHYGSLRAIREKLRTEGVERDTDSLATIASKIQAEKRGVVEARADAIPAWGFPYEDVRGRALARETVERVDMKTGVATVNGLTYMTKMNLAKKIGRSEGMVDRLLRHGELTTVRIRDKVNVETDGYPVEGIERTLEKLLKLPPVERAGNEKGFITYDEEKQAVTEKGQGTRYGIVQALADEFGIPHSSISRALSEAKEDRFAIKELAVRDGHDNSRTAYAVSDVEAFPRIKRLREAKPVGEDGWLKEGEFNFSTLKKIEEKMREGSPMSNKKRGERIRILTELATTKNVEKRFIRFPGGTTEQAYCYEQLVTLFYEHETS